MVDTLTEKVNQIQTPIRTLPQHIGIIMDGNGRWARSRGLPRHAGHRAGVENLRRVIRAVTETGIPHLSIYAFSTENWKRPRGEVKRLIALIDRSLQRELPELHQEGVQLRHLGNLDGLSRSTQRNVRKAIELTQDNGNLILNIAFNYGGRAELTNVIRKILHEGIPADDIGEALVERHLYTAGQPHPELIIRTAGEMRLSNFLLWQSAGATLYATKTYWPDFGEDELTRALQYFCDHQKSFSGGRQQ
jgi:undecaprenyl diphosphate synthase